VYPLGSIALLVTVRT
jgi:hypothetical protein